MCNLRLYYFCLLRATYNPYILKEVVRWCHYRRGVELIRLTAVGLISASLPDILLSLWLYGYILSTHRFLFYFVGLLLYSIWCYCRFFLLGSSCGSVRVFVPPMITSWHLPPVRKEEDGDDNNSRLLELLEKNISSWRKIRFFVQRNDWSLVWWRLCTKDSY